MSEKHQAPLPARDEIEAAHLALVDVINYFALMRDLEGGKVSDQERPAVKGHLASIAARHGGAEVLERVSDLQLAELEGKAAALAWVLHGGGFRALDHDR